MTFRTVFGSRVHVECDFKSLFVLIGACLISVQSAAATHLPAEAAVQTIYRNGVPHTDKNGQLRFEYDPHKSFFMIGVMPVIEPKDSPLDWSKDIKAAGFNTVLPWHNPPYDYLAEGAKHDLQVVVMFDQSEDYVLKNADHPNLLAWYWADEPTQWLGKPENDDMWKRFNAAVQHRDRVAPNVKIFVNDIPALDDARRASFLKWTLAGDMSMHDNYPVHVARTETISEPNAGIPQSMSFVVNALKERKPAWYIAPAFSDDAPPTGNAFRYPSDDQLRAIVFTAIVHGATGLVYFAADGTILRPTGNFGIAPHMPKAGYGEKSVPLTDAQAKRGEELWHTVTKLNAEISRFVPYFLSPTVKAEELFYNVVSSPSPYTKYPVRTILKPDLKGGYYLFAVNNDDVTCKVTIRLNKRMAASSDGSTSTVLKTSFEKNNQTLLTDEFAPFAVNIYHLLPASE